MSKKEKRTSNLVDVLDQKRLSWTKRRVAYKKKVTELKSVLYKNSHSLLWVWEFSKKAVLICFIFHAIVQIYSMSIMIKFQDFTYLGDLITQNGEIVKECVFVYLIKAGVENFGKIYFHNNNDDSVG